MLNAANKVSLAESWIDLMVDQGYSHEQAEESLEVELAALNSYDRGWVEVFVAGGYYGAMAWRKRSARILVDEPNPKLSEVLAPKVPPPSDPEFLRPLSPDDDGQPAWIIVWIGLAFLCGIIAAALVIGGSR